MSKAYQRLLAIAAKLETATKKIADMSPEELREYRKTHPLKGKGKEKGPAKSAQPKAPGTKAPAKGNKIAAPAKVKIPKLPAAIKNKDKAPPAPKTHGDTPKPPKAKGKDKAPAMKAVENPHKPAKEAKVAEAPPKEKFPKKGSLTHDDAIGHAGKTLGFTSKTTPAPWNDKDDVSYTSKGDRTKDAIAHFKKLGYGKQATQDYGDSHVHVLQHPSEQRQVTITHHPASNGGEEQTIIR